MFIAYSTVETLTKTSPFSVHLTVNLYVNPTSKPPTTILALDDKIRTINPNSEVTFETVKGWNTKSEIKKNGDVFKFYYTTEAGWEEIKNHLYYEEDDMQRNAWNFTDAWVSEGFVRRLVLENKQSKSYTVKITDTNVYIYSNEE